MSPTARCATCPGWRRPVEIGDHAARAEPQTDDHARRGGGRGRKAGGRDETAGRGAGGYPGDGAGDVPVVRSFAIGLTLAAVLLVGIAASNSILIVEFAHRQEGQGRAVEDAVITSCRVRLRPILMTSLATMIGLAPMALKLGTGSEQYAPLARAIIGGVGDVGAADGVYCAGGVRDGVPGAEERGGEKLGGTIRVGLEVRSAPAEPN